MVGLCGKAPRWASLELFLSTVSAALESDGRGLADCCSAGGFAFFPYIYDRAAAGHTSRGAPVRYSTTGIPTMTSPRVAPYGSWKAPITSDRIVAGTVTLEQVALDGEDVYWIE